jgi:hypothetical protein
MSIQDGLKLNEETIQVQLCMVCLSFVNRLIK